jgi:uncharacterized membrane protein YjfL (UPF0719 family)
MAQEFHPMALANAGIFAALGIVILIISFAIVDWISPYKLWEEIVEQKNVALAILVGAMSIGASIIIASAIH